MRNRYVPNVGSLDPILVSEAMREAVVEFATVIQTRAKGLAPVASGAYRESITVEADRHPTRWVAHVGPDVEYGAVVESRAHTMRRSLG